MHERGGLSARADLLRDRHLDDVVRVRGVSGDDPGGRCPAVLFVGRVHHEGRDLRSPRRGPDDSD